MGVRINPCHGCPLREGCDQRDEFRKRVSGLGLRSATFRCAKLAEALRPGRRVMVPTPEMRVQQVYPGDFDCRIEMVAVPATVTASDDAGGFSGVIDPGHVYGRPEEVTGEPSAPADKYRFRKKMRSARIIRILDEPDRKICEQGRVMVGDQCDKPADEICHCEAMRGFEDWLR